MTRHVGSFTFLIAVVALAAACTDKPKTSEPALTSAAVERPALAKVPLVVPAESTIPPGEQGELVRRGRLLATRTFEEVPELVGSDLHCSSCHLEAGTKAGAGPWVGLSSAFPEYRARAGHEVTLEERLAECFERSMNGKAPERSGPVMKAFVAYIDWLSQGVPKGSEVEGRGFPKIAADARPPIVDRDSGESAYAARCASCHGADGAGRRGPEGSYQYPPLWGARTFNIAAGMARLDTAAAFVRHNMPLGQGDTLTASEAYDIALYFTKQGRPDFEGKRRDWPNGGKPADARY